MARVVHRVTLEVRLRVNTPDFSPTEWVINPSALTSLIGDGTPDVPDVPKRYWIIDPPGSRQLREMTALEKLAADGNPLQLIAARRSKKAELTVVAQSFLESRYDAIFQLNLLELRLTATGQALQALNNWLGWVRDLLSALNTRLDLVDAAASVPAIEAIAFDPSPFIATDPNITLQSLL